MLQMPYETNVYIGVLLSETPFVHKSRIQGPKNLNWRKPFQIIWRQNGELAKWQCGLILYHFMNVLYLDLTKYIPPKVCRLQIRQFAK